MSCERKARHSKSCPSVSWPNFPQVVSETLESRSERCRQIVDTVHQDHEVLLSPCGLTKGRREKTQVASVGSCSRPHVCAVRWPQDPGRSQPPAEPHLPDCGSQSCPISPRLPQRPPPAPPATSRPPGLFQRCWLTAAAANLPPGAPLHSLRRTPLGKSDSSLSALGNPCSLPSQCMGRGHLARGVAGSRSGPSRGQGARHRSLR